MSNTRIFTAALSVAFLFTLASSVSADPVHVPPGQVKFNLFEVQTFDFSDIGKADIRGLLADHFAHNNGNHFGFRNQLFDLSAGNSKHLGSGGVLSENPFANNNGRHLGFSVASAGRGLKIGVTNHPRRPTTSVTENPEPTGMILLGTGLAAGAAFMRRRSRNRRRTSER